MLEDVADGYVTVRRAASTTASSSGSATRSSRVPARRGRDGGARAEPRRPGGRLEEDPDAIAERFRAGELDALDLIRRYGVIVDWGTGELLERTTSSTASSSGDDRREHWGR